MLQNSIQNQPNIDSLVATLLGSGENKNNGESTSENLKENGEIDKEEDELLQNLAQECECQEERGPPPTNKKLEKILQDLLWDVFKKHFFEKVVMDTLPPKKF